MTSRNTCLETKKNYIETSALSVQEVKHAKLVNLSLTPPPLEYPTADFLTAHLVLALTFEESRLKIFNPWIYLHDRHAWVQ